MVRVGTGEACLEAGRGMGDEWREFPPPLDFDSLVATDAILSASDSLPVVEQTD